MIGLNNTKNEDHIKSVKSKKPYFSAFLMFKNDTFQQIKNENSNINTLDLIKIISEKWTAPNSTIKEEYEYKISKAREKHKKDLIALKDNALKLTDMPLNYQAQALLNIKKLPPRPKKPREAFWMYF